MSLLPYDACPTSLATINNLCFTRREVDIMACLLNARGTSKTASLLSIAPKTVVNHIRNIMIKLDCNSREGIIDFIERSHKLPLFRKHYSNLVINAVFEKSLKDASRFHRDKTLSFRILYEEKNEYHKQLAYQLISHFRSVGVNTLAEPQLTLIPLFDLVSTLQKEEKIVYFLEEEQIEGFLSNNLSTEALSPISSQAIPLNRILFILPERENLSPLPEHFSCLEYVDLSQRKNYYFLFFEVLGKLVSNANIEKIFQEFKNFYEAAEKNPGAQLSFTELGTKDEEQTKGFFLTATKQALQHRSVRFLIAAFMSIIAFGISFVFFRSPNSLNFLESSRQFPLLENEYPIRSDLNIPNGNAFLTRPELIEKINKVFKYSQEIEYLALVGVGGAGKTTLARQYARQQKNNVTWEINAENKDSFINSFRELARFLSRTKEHKEELDLIDKIQNSEEREKQLLFSVKNSLRAHKNWILIYDNVENFAEIKNYLPHDAEVWGKGKVIITTRDSNIKDTSYIKPNNVIHVEELSVAEALILFSKILYDIVPEKLRVEQREKALQFLQHIPSFPLDISIAAYYIKNSKITPEQYLERISQQSQSFEEAQRRLLQDTNNYTKTRYSIIVSSLKKVLEINPRFKEFLLAICLLDSQNIPKELMEFYKDKILIEEFIYHLKKYSLITNDSLSTLSLHRSTQIHGKAFLLSLLTEDEKKDILNKILTTTQTSYEHYAKESSPSVVLFLPHLEVLAKNLEDIKLPQNIQEKYTSNLLLMIGYVHADHSRDLELAKKYLTQVYTLNKGNSYLPNDIFATLLKDLGDIYSLLGILDKALFFCQESIKKAEKMLHTEILIAENLIVMGYIHQLRNNFQESKHALKSALKSIKEVDKELKGKLESDIYTELANLYSTTFLNKKKGLKAEKYALKALEAFNVSELFHLRKSQQKIPCYVAKLRMILGRIYTRLGKYNEAEIQGFKEAEYVLEHSKCSDPLLKARLYSYKAELLLSKKQSEEAEDILTKSLEIREKIFGKTDPAIMRVYRAEARIRRGRLKEAYDDCIFIFEMGQKYHNNYSTLMYLTCIYHAAIIKYKQDDLSKSLEHFADFFKRMKSFCLSFLEEKEYQELETKGVFTELSYGKGQLKEHVTQRLKYSATIFSAIYGGNHPFVRDYVLKNCE